MNVRKDLEATTRLLTAHDHEHRAAAGTWQRRGLLGRLVRVEAAEPSRLVQPERRQLARAA